MPDFIDETGKRHGRWTVLERDFNRQGHWVCRCDCGTIRSVDGASLRSGGTFSCGCLAKDLQRLRAENLAGQRFGLWTVLYGPTTRSGEQTKWHCRCDCGTERDVYAINLKRGMTQSCGCVSGEKISKARTTHGKRKTRLYTVWVDMRRRCCDVSNSAFKNYGGRGITICDEWLGRDGFQNFWDWAYSNGYDENAPKGGCTLDRIDVNGDYTPDNCRWITMKEQMRNRTTTVYLTVDGVQKPLIDWAEEYGISESLVSARIKRGWDAKRALTEKPKQMWEDVEYNGETHSYSEWARILGIKKKTIQYRVQHGWTTEEIMSPLGTVNHVTGKGVSK